ncbi:MAG TPA: hypothetical protein VFV87_13400 [Pirellulaceae bacterium]|nr:hypothetical protein [Pirellulaceae bacterium]
MRQVVLIGLLAAAAVTLASCSGVILLVALVLSNTGRSGHTPTYDTPIGSYSSYSRYDDFGAGTQPIYVAPANDWPDNPQWSGSISHGTRGATVQDSIYSVDGKVLNLPY